MSLTRFAGCLAATLLLASPTLAKVPAEQASRLDKDLTPYGAERAGNAAGTIPAWTGGLTAPPENVDYMVGDHHPDPFADDPVLFTITAANMAEHEALMTGTTKVMMRTYPDTYFMKVYSSRRTCAVPEAVYAATRRNAEVGDLVEGGDGVTKAINGKPFPIPNNAYEIIWNHKVNFFNFKVARQFAAAVPSKNGSYSELTIQDEAIIHWNDPTKESAEAIKDNIYARYITHTIAPARRAGSITLVHETLNKAKAERQAWQYSPGTKRVRRAPNIAYDNPGVNSDGATTVDSLGGFNGALDRYTWTVIGKREAYIPYNNYRLGSDELSYDDIIRPIHQNQENPRYELHRVWMIEANLKSTKRHIYQRRLFYIDEDSWRIVATELFDTRGEPWRVQELFPTQAYEVPLCAGIAATTYDLNAQRYLIGGLINEEPAINYFADDLKEDRYTPQAIRRLGKR